MFGYVRPAADHLTAEQQARFEAAYCGLCHTLGKRYGIAGRMILNYDLTFLAMLLSDGQHTACRRRCVMHPGKGRMCVCGDDAFDLAADMSVILTWWQIQDGIADTPEKMKRYLDTIHTKAEVIDDLVNNLSVFSKLELSRLIFEFKEGDINSFMRDFVDDYRLDLEKNGIKLETDIPIDEVIVRMDYEKISRVFSNLIDNAVKYRSEDNPTLSVSTMCSDGGVYVNISDNGIGIDENELKNVFDGFYRVDSSRSIKGSGLGLGIAKQIVEKHGGKIWLKSDGLGKGTTAVVFLPKI